MKWEYEEFMEEPATFTEWCYQEKKEQKIASDVWIITLNCLTAMLPTFGLARIAAPHGHSTDEIVASLDSIVHILRDLGMRVVMTASDGDSTLLMKVGPAMQVLTAVSGG
jgi:hypothetical protein